MLARLIELAVARHETVVASGEQSARSGTTSRPRAEALPDVSNLNAMSIDLLHHPVGRSRGRGLRPAAVPVLCALVLGAGAPAPAAPLGALTMDQAVELAHRQSREAIAARLEIDVAKVDVITARLYPNPTLALTLGNLVLGAANSQGRTPPVSAGFFGQTITSLGVTQTLDLWNKRGTRTTLAERSVAQKRLEVEETLRQITFNVRAAFADIVREQSEMQLARDIHDRHRETVRLSRVRHDAGEISAADLNKIELESLKYETDVLDAQMQLDLARQKLAGLLGLESTEDLPAALPEVPTAPGVPALATLIDAALAERPDVRAAALSRTRATAALAAARREALPDLSVGLAFTHDEFTVSGDNANGLAFSLSLPLPLFDRGQDKLARARLDQRRAENEAARLAIVVRREVADAVRQAVRAHALIAIFEGGMLKRADTALMVAERSWKAGSSSLLELLEAQRTYIEARAQYLKAKSDYRQAMIAVAHAVGGRIQ
jgi:cobalt-zinc-cadmium efflux system outer membrane protein